MGYKVDSEGCNREVGLVMRKFKEKKKGKVEEVVRLLLVRASKNSQQWVLPKGHIEVGEQPGVTAVREVYEETGVWAKPLNYKEVIKIKTPDETYKARFHLMEFIREEKALEDRKTGWFTKKEAMEKLEFEESKSFIMAALEK